LINARQKAAAIAVVVLQLAGGRQACALEPGEVLQLAEDAGRWIATTAIAEPGAGPWPDDALAPATAGVDLANGVSGKVVYFVGLYRATGNPEYLALAREGTDYLIGKLDETARTADESHRASLYRGIAGIGLALLCVLDELPEQNYEQALERIVGFIEEWAIQDDAGIHWSPRFNDLLYGDAGTVLFLATVAEQQGDDQLLTLARQGAHALLHRSLFDGDKRYWLFRRDKTFNLPNFSHGTAGIVYVLATVGALADDAGLRAGAAAGFKYLRSIAEVSDGRLRMPYGWGQETWQGLYEFGWAHGLAGTARSFHRLGALGIDADYADRLIELTLNTLADIGLPAPPAEPFAEPATPLDFRFGRAGTLALVSHWASAHPTDVTARDLRDRLFRHIEHAAVRADNTAHWNVDAPAFMGGGRAAYTGLLHGAAGIGLALLHLHADLLGRPAYVSLPDDPL
jgi:lantibiotic modifying enzyme